MTEIARPDQASNFWHSEQIRLRGVEAGDAEVFFGWNQDTERGRMLDFLWPPSSLASVRAFTEQQARQKLENDAFHWVIETLAGVPVGSISTHDCSLRNGSFSYGVDIAYEQRGHGYAGQAIRLVLRYYFNELRYQKAAVSIHADNPASQRLHEKLGFQLEGRLRKAIYTNGGYSDVLLYGLLSEEFQHTETR